MFGPLGFHIVMMVSIVAVIGGVFVAGLTYWVDKDANHRDVDGH
jgi:hypothetical protein